MGFVFLWLPIAAKLEFSGHLITFRRIPQISPDAKPIFSTGVIGKGTIFPVLHRIEQKTPLLHQAEQNKKKLKKDEAPNGEWR